jgi:aspartate aminotransferase
MTIAKRMDSLSESLTMAITALAKEMKASGKDVISFSAGEPDIGTPQVIKDAAIEALEKGETKYTAVEGTIEARTAIANKLKKDNGLDYDISEIIISVGAKHSLFNIFQAMIEEGDEVIIPAPFWVTYPEQVKFSGGTPVIIETNDDSEFKITAEQLKNAITPKTKLLLLNSPSNPTGGVYSKEELEALAEVLKGTDVMVASDEMYEKIVYDGTVFTATASLSEDMLNRTITINGLSKAVSMTGWRFGYIACKNKELVKNMRKLQSQCTSNICSVAQYAGIAALDGRADADIEYMRSEFEKRKQVVYEKFNEIEGLSAINPKGAFYIYINIKDVEPDSMVFCEKLLEQKGVAVVPGLGFGLDGYFRFSFATDIETIEDGINRIADFVKNYK